MQSNTVFTNIAAALTLIAALAVSVPPAYATESRPPLSEVTEITDGIMVVGIANIVRRRCDSISARMFKGWSYVNSLKSTAKSMGYTSSEINAFLKNKEEEAKITQRGRALLEARGVREDDPESFCVFGREEIAKSSLIGSFLRAN